MRFVIAPAALALATGLVVYSQFREQRKQRDEAALSERLRDSLSAVWERERREREYESQRYFEMVLRYGGEYVTRDSTGRARVRTDSELTEYRRRNGIPERRRICGVFSGQYQCVMASIW